MSCFKSNITMNFWDATMLLNLYIYLVFVGNGWLSVAPSFLPHLRQLNLFRCDILCYKYVVELDAAVPALNIFHGS